MADFTMPSLGADMEEGTVTEWLVKPGDEVHRGDIVAVVDTEKSSIEVEIFETGTIEEIVAPEGVKVPVGAVLARVRPAVVAVGQPVGAGAPGPSIAPPLPSPPVPSGPPAPPVPSPPPVLRPTAPTGPSFSPLVRHLAEHSGVDLAALAGTGPGGSVTRADVERAAARHHPPPPRPGAAAWVRASPLARRLAREKGLDLAAIAGTGPLGAVIAADVWTARPPAAPAAGLDRAAAMRRATGQLMARSKREIPHYYLGRTIDLARALSWLERTNETRPVQDRLVASVLLLKATAVAVKRVPEMNGFYRDDRFDASEAVHLGVAVSLRGGGLIAPAIRDAAAMPVDELMARVRDLVGRARGGRLKSSEVSDATITVTNLGELGADWVVGVIYPPQVALVGFGNVADRPVAGPHGEVVLGPCVTVTLAADHRVSDGHRGARFLAEIDRLLQEPEEL